MDSKLDKIAGWTIPRRGEPYFKIMPRDSASCAAGKEKFNRVMHESWNELDDLPPVELIAKTVRLSAELRSSIAQIIKECSR